MTSFRKQLLIGIAALSLGAGSLAVHAGTPGPDGSSGAGGAGMGEHGRYGERMQERMAKRMAELHDKLKLDAAQEKAWNAYIAKVKPAQPPARPDRAELDKLTAPERMERMLARMKQGEKRFEQRIAATKEFYAVLTPEQKKIFDDAFRHRPGHRSEQR